MSRYDGLIIPRSYSEYINKTDAATLQQALQLSGVLSGAVAAGDNKPVTSDAVNTALGDYYNKQSVGNLLNNLQNQILKYYSFKNETGNFIYYRLGSFDSFISEITALRVNGYQRDSLCFFKNGAASRIRGNDGSKDWSCYVGIGDNNDVYVAVASYSVCTVKITAYSITSINPVRYYANPNFIATDLKMTITAGA